ncbi:alpha/beta fold hydrolase [Telmatospirillum siberiense]|uniref:alpha/beta fold hydrolase n=1 Tax=Telmatospirillum siberiense TaxID=382514 RepID=UPI0018ED1233|nr:alpha/beta hydrolase [Telmatospirillum siberiense]
MSPVFLLVHGWGFDASFWTPLRDALAGTDSIAWDLGFHGSLSCPPPPAGRPVIAVGHSYGLLWLLEKRPVAWQSLVSINGFPRFAAGGDFPEGVPPRLLDRMIARFGEAPEAVYRDFMIRCGVADPSRADLDPKALADGLNALRHWDARSRMADLGPADLVLAGRADPIVPEGLTKAGFSGQDIFWHESGHLLPLEAPEWCAARLRRLHGGLFGGEPARHGAGWN